MPPLTPLQSVVSSRVLLVSIVVSLILFAALTALLFAGGLDAFDQKALTLFRAQASFDDPLGPAWVEESLRDVTALGSRAALGLLVISIATFLFLQKRKRLSTLLIVSTLFIVFLNTALKLSIDRPRPQIVKHEARVFSPSFPSAHAMESSSLYLMSAFLVCFITSCGRVMKVFTFSLAIFTIFAVGFSRMYLGVHYPSDIFSGWLMGIACAGVFMLLAQGLQGPRVKQDAHHEKII